MTKIGAVFKVLYYYKSNDFQYIMKALFHLSIKGNDDEI